MQPLFFAKPSELRQWFEDNHDKEREVLIGFYKKGTKLPSITWSESVDEALCFGWIDGIRKSIDETSYMIRFTPRKPKSIWSAVNLQKVEELTQKGLMQPTGLAIYHQREQKNEKVYAFEQTSIELNEEYEAKFKANIKAWDFFASQAPYYQKTAIWWVISAKREETRLKRLQILIEDSEVGQKIGQLRR
jgi:uncharacterized protein YdeI (YjbR/CyaY-like superfamily)